MLFKSVFSSDLTKKSCDIPYFSYFLGSNVTLADGTTPLGAIKWYNLCAPLDTAIDNIGIELPLIKPTLFDSKRKDYITDHPFLTFLSKVNPFLTYNNFIQKVNLHYQLIGDVFIVLSGDVNKEPLEMDIYDPTCISIKANTKDGYPETYIYSCGNAKIEFKRDEREDRFFNKDGNLEIVHLKTLSIGDELTGRSKITSLELQIAQYIAAAVHNKSMLENQMRPSGILAFKTEGQSLSTEQKDNLQEELKQNYSSFTNAGKTLVLQGDLDWVPMSESLKDMDFKELDKRTSITIYNKYRIPLPLVSPDHMTLSNMEVAKLSLYDNAVLPAARTFFEFFQNKILKTRYKNSDNLSLIFEESEISTLRFRAVKTVETLKKININTTNELRTILGYEALDDNGADQVFMPNNLVPLGTDIITGGNREVPSNPRKALELDYAYSLLKNQKTKLGHARYSDNEIDKIIKDFDIS